MQWTQLPLGPLQTNAYVLINDDKEAIIFDPGGQGLELVEWLQTEKLKPLAILLTHAHFDHIGAVDVVRDAFNCPVYLHTLENDWLGNPEKNRSTSFLGGEAIIVRPADVLIEKEESISIGAFHFQVYATPGHSPGSVSYYCTEEQIVFFR